MSIVGNAAGSPEKISQPKFLSGVKAHEKLKGILLEHLPLAYEMAEVSSLKYSHQTVPMATQLALQGAIERMDFPPLEEELYLAEGEALSNLVALTGLLTLSSLTGAKEQSYEYTHPDYPNSKFVYSEKGAHLISKEKLDPETHAKVVEAMKTAPNVPPQVKTAADTGKISNMTEEEYEKAKNLAAGLSECLQAEIEKEVSKQEPKKTAHVGMVRRSSQISMRSLKVAVGVQAAAIRILARSMIREEARQSKKLEEEIQKERAEAKEAAKEDAKRKEQKFRDLMKKVLNEEIMRFEVLQTAADEQLDKNEYGFVAPGRN